MKKTLSILFASFLIFTASLSVFAAEKFSEDFSDPSKLTYFAFENDGFIVQDGAFVAKSINKYNAAYYGEYYESCVYEFDFKDFGEGNHVGGASLRVGSARYDVEVRSDAVNDDEKIVIWKGGPNKKASNTMKATGKGIPSIPVGSWTNIKIAMTRDTIKVYANDILYLDYKDSLPYTQGGFGIRSSNSKIGYDNIKIYDIADLKLSPKPTSVVTSTTISSNSSSVSKPSTNSTTVSESLIESVESSSSVSQSDIAIQSSSQESSADSNLDSSSVESQNSISESGDDTTNSSFPTTAIIIIIVAIVLVASTIAFLLFRKKNR